MTNQRRIVLLGSTGSIGLNCLDVVANLPERLQIVGLSAHSNWETLLDQAERWQPRWITITNPEALVAIRNSPIPPGCQVLFGEDGITAMVTDPETDIVVTAIVGAAGLRGTWAALEAGKTVAVANKETLVMAGPLVMDLAQKHRARVLPVDSEHSAIFQALQSGRADEVERVVLTASGGPFRGRNLDQLSEVTVEDALRHPDEQSARSH